MRNISQKELSSIKIPKPSELEQTEIVRRVDQLFAFADQIEQRVAEAKKRMDHLTQSILAKAFRGDLTAQWRAENPDLISGTNSAEALLARIKAERDSASASPTRKAAHRSVTAMVSPEPGNGVQPTRFLCFRMNGLTL